MTAFDNDFFSNTPSEWAYRYRALGWNIVPAKNKHPVVKWREWRDTKIPEAQHQRWWGPGGEYAGHRDMGVITGTGSDRLFAVDLDLHKDPRATEWWADYLATDQGGQDLKTPEQITGGGGAHKFFKAPAHWVPPTNKTKIGVDIRGEGGFIMLAPSPHPSGKDYAWKAGHEPWQLEVLEAPQSLCDAIDNLVEEQGGDRPSYDTEQTAQPASEKDAFGNDIDGRETKLRNMVHHGVLEWHRECPIRPPESSWEARARSVYVDYERTTNTRIPGVPRAEGLEREQRGWTEFWRKWRYKMRQWGTPKFTADSARPDPNPKSDFDPRQFEDNTRKAEEQARANPSQLYELFNIDQIEAMPDPLWLVKGLVIQRATGFIYGHAGSWKTFIGLDIALSIACGCQQWWGRDIKGSGPVIYITSENQGDLKFRIKAWRQHRGVESTSAPFRLLWQNLNFMHPDNRGKLLATIEALVAELGQPVAAIFVDTVSRVLPGINENSAEEISLFIGVCDDIRQRFGCTIVGIHHKARAGNIRGSTVLEGAGDFILEVKRDGEDDKDDDAIKSTTSGTIKAVKVKAASDQWLEPFNVKQIHLGDIAGSSSLVVDVAIKPTAGRSDLPDWDTCRQILSELHHAWQSKHPWSASARATDRYAVTMIMEGWEGVSRDQAAALLKGWRRNKVIEVDRINGKDGYKKLKDL